MKRLLCIVLIVLLVGSPVTVKSASPLPGYTRLGRYADTNVGRFIDEEAGVVCWITYRGISCLPLPETNLK